MLALSFLVLIGVVLIAEGGGAHISRGYVYVAMMFAMSVELLNMRARKRRAQKAMKAAMNRKPPAIAESVVKRTATT